MDAAWYMRLLLPALGRFACSFLLNAVIQPKRMTSPGGSKELQVVTYVGLVVGWVLMWFISYEVDVFLWVGLGIIILGLIVFSLGYIAMREHPERKQVVVDWGIYRVSRHSHVLAGVVCLLGTVLMGWKTDSVWYWVLWAYFVLYAALSHLWVLSEEKINLEKFGQDYADYMDRVPRYFFGKV